MDLLCKPLLGRLRNRRACQIVSGGQFCRFQAGFFEGHARIGTKRHYRQVASFSAPELPGAADATLPFAEAQVEAIGIDNEPFSPVARSQCASTSISERHGGILG